MLTTKAQLELSLLLKERELIATNKKNDMLRFENSVLERVISQLENGPVWQALEANSKLVNAFAQCLTTLATTNERLRKEAPNA